MTSKNYSSIVMSVAGARLHMNKKGGKPVIYPKLRGRIREKFGTQEAFALATGMSPSTLSSKLSGKTDWTRQEIERVCELLGIPMAEAHTYFFAL